MPHGTSAGIGPINQSSESTQTPSRAHHRQPCRPLSAERGAAAQRGGSETLMSLLCNQWLLFKAERRLMFNVLSLELDLCSVCLLFDVLKCAAE